MTYLPGFFSRPTAPSFTNTKSLKLSTVSNLLLRTSGVGDSLRKMTFNFWHKAHVGDGFFVVYNPEQNDGIGISVALGQITLTVSLGGGGSGSPTFLINGANIDVYAQYTVQIDTDNATAGNRVKCWVNNVAQTNTGTNAAENYDTGFSLDTATEAVCYIISTTDGVSLIDEISKIDNALIAPTAFASGSAPIDISGLTFGAQGYWIRFETSVGANAGIDSSGHGNDFASNYANGDMSSTVPT